MKQYTIVGGVNGVGKTSFIGIFKEFCPSVGEIIDPDKITAEMSGNTFSGCKIALKRIRTYIRYRAEVFRLPLMLVTNCLRQLAAGDTGRIRTDDNSFAYCPLEPLLYVAH